MLLYVRLANSPGCTPPFCLCWRERHQHHCDPNGISGRKWMNWIEDNHITRRWPNPLWNYKHFKIWTWILRPSIWGHHFDQSYLLAVLKTVPRTNWNTMVIDAVCITTKTMVKWFCRNVCILNQTAMTLFLYYFERQIIKGFRSSGLEYPRC